MVTVSVFKMSSVPEKLDIVYRLDGEKVGDCKFQTRRSRFDDNEIKINVFYEEDIEVGMKRAFSNKAWEMVHYLKERGQEKIQKKIVCFLDMEKGTLEVYRGKDHVTSKIEKGLERLLRISLEPVNLDHQSLLTIVNQRSEEMKKALFKYIHGMWYQVLRGNKLESNQKYLEYISAKPEALRQVSVIPKIDWTNGSKYMVTFDGEKGTIQMYDGSYRGKPRAEVKQLVNLALRVAG